MAKSKKSSDKSKYSLAAKVAAWFGAIVLFVPIALYFTAIASFFGFLLGSKVSNLVGYGLGAAVAAFMLYICYGAVSYFITEEQEKSKKERGGYASLEGKQASEYRAALQVRGDRARSMKPRRLSGEG